MKLTHKLTTLVLGISFLFSGSVLGISSPARLKQNMFSDLDTIKHYFDVKYAPLNWKKEFANLDLEAELKTAKVNLENNKTPSIKDFQVILKDFLNTVKDYHVNVHYYSTEQACLPLIIKGAAGRYFIGYIKRSYLPSYLFPFQVGDEVLEFDGQPIEQVIADLKKQELGSNTQETDQALAELLLTCRQGEMGHIVPRGSSSLKIKKKSDGSVETAILRWDYYPEKIKDIASIYGSLQTPEAHLKMNLEEDFETLIVKSHFFEKMMVHSMFGKSYLNTPLARGNPHTVGAWRSYLPPLGKKQWEGSDDDSFDAYIFETSSGKQIGYLRIPHYMCDEPEAEDFQFLIGLFENHTDALVIDQFNNPGGSVFYLYALASMLTDRRLETPKHRIALTQEEVYVAASILPILSLPRTDADARSILGQTIGGYPVTMKVIKTMRHFCQFIINEWNKGNFLTEPTFIMGVDQINPHPRVNYTKPILLLVNELDFSAADFFPAILKDNKRATLLGTRTAGAGGYVIDFSFPNNMGIKSLSLTGSIAERLNHQPLENLGVEPDISCPLTPRDMQEGYEDLASTILKTLERITSSS